MNRVAERFRLLKEKGQKALITYIMGGDPDLAATAELIEILAQNGVDLIEIGVPFSDPLADGPVIQAAGQRSLANGCNLAKLLQAIKPAIQKVDIPVVLMIYYNMIMQRSLPAFFAEISAAGCSGLIIPDLPPDEAEELITLGNQYNVALNFLVAPTSSETRVIKAAESTTGFIYAVSLKGVTGARDSLATDLPEFINRVKSKTDQPVAVGFGISKPEQARKVVELADGVIVGSAIVKTIAEDRSYQKTIKLVKELKASIC
ncbi:MAG TPA: tryptophan synthase subunit alpha [Bacillota bacterium]|nr:tryptophan synthase subunit alpha [Bacillota bacterium]HOL09378.1 tryptophan synthase subunit alpha [Bacillota bacterium]HPO97073.1 tryptophan synthase subunit alpha [Bacillota bacterium]